MKETLLLFVPGAHPTYMPLGIASLYAYLNESMPGYRISALDLNIRLWNYIFESASPVSLAPVFFRGLLGDFYSKETYTAYLAELSQFYSEFHGIESELKKFLNTGEITPKTAFYKEFITRELNLLGDETLALSVMYPDQVVHMLTIGSLLKKELPGLTIIAGGAALASVDINELMNAAPFIDAFYRGEGEYGISLLISGTPLESIRGLSYRSEGVNIHNSSPAAIPMSELPVPDFSFCNFNDYFNPEPVLPVVFSRGCRWRGCRFCSHNFSFAGYRTSAYSAFADKLAHYKDKYGVSNFYFADQYIDADDLLNISREISARDLKISFQVMGRPTGDYTTEVLENAFKAGCRWISWGVESGSATLLNICNKGTVPAVIEEVLARSADAGISNLAMMIFGLPGTDSEKFQETLDFADRVSPFVDAFTSSSFQLFEGTPFFKSRASLDIELSGREILANLSGNEIHSIRWNYKILSDSRDESITPGQSEVKKWKQWKSWVRGGDTFREMLGSEHYLLYCAHDKNSKSNHPGRPTTPSRPILPRTG